MFNSTLKKEGLAMVIPVAASLLQLHYSCILSGTCNEDCNCNVWGKGLQYQMKTEAAELTVHSQIVSLPTLTTTAGCGGCIHRSRTAQRHG